MSKSNPYTLSDNTPVEAFDKDWKKVGEYDSLRKAANRLYIKSSASIWGYLYKGNALREKRGVKSKVTGNLYHFKLK